MTVSVFNLRGLKSHKWKTLQHALLVILRVFCVCEETCIAPPILTFLPLPLSLSFALILDKWQGSYLRILTKSLPLSRSRIRALKNDKLQQCCEFFMHVCLCSFAASLLIFIMLFKSSLSFLCVLLFPAKIKFPLIATYIFEPLLRSSPLSNSCFKISPLAQDQHTKQERTLRVCSNNGATDTISKTHTRKLKNRNRKLRERKLSSRRVLKVRSNGHT